MACGVNVVEGGATAIRRRAESESRFPDAVIAVGSALIARRLPGVVVVVGAAAARPARRLAASSGSAAVENLEIIVSLSARLLVLAGLSGR